MSAITKVMLTLIGVLVFTVGASFKSAGADGMPVQITNNGTEEVEVTVYDMNTQTHQPVLAHERLYGFSSVLVSLTADASGTGHVLWTATTHENGAVRCGRANTAGLTPDASVDVYADAACNET
jgi:hypothetical protein